MIILGNVLSILAFLSVALIAMFAGAFWDSPKAPPYPTGLVMLGLFLLLIFLVASVKYSHSQHSWIWAYAPAATIVVLELIGFVILSAVQ